MPRASPTAAVRSGSSGHAWGRAQGMAGTIRDQIAATGLAQVIVFLKSAAPRARESGVRGVAAAAEAAAEGLDRHFDRSEFGRDGALASAAAELTKARRR